MCTESRSRKPLGMVQDCVVSTRGNSSSPRLGRFQGKEILLGQGLAREGCLTAEMMNPAWGTATESQANKDLELLALFSCWCWFFGWNQLEAKGRHTMSVGAWEIFGSRSEEGKHGSCPVKRDLIGNLHTLLGTPLRPFRWVSLARAEKDWLSGLPLPPCGRASLQCGERWSLSLRKRRKYCKTDIEAKNNSVSLKCFFFFGLELGHRPGIETSDVALEDSA